MSFLKIVIFSSLCFTVSKSLNLGDQCLDETSGLNGTCQFVADFCNFTLKYHTIPQYCGNRAYCCPPVQLRRSEQMCKNYFFEWNKFVAFGTPARLREFRHMAAIGFSQNYRIIWACGGSIISPYFILSAAHCVKDRNLGPAKWVRIGDLDLVNTTEGANPQDLHIVQSFVHPDYTPSTHYNDIALFKLEKKITFGDDYKPACLHASGNIPQPLVATGWGQTDNFKELSTHLMKVDLHVVDYTQCERKYRNVRKLPRGIVDGLQICAGNTLGQDTCPGDSGGPLQFKSEELFNVKEHYVVVGITSFGKACGIADTSGVYTRISPYLDWIEHIVWPVE